MDILIKNLDEYPTESDVRGARTLITYCKNMMLTDKEIEELGKKEAVPLLQVYGEYNEYLRSNSLMDYDDQMVYAYKMLRSSPDLLKYYQDMYRYICVDEAQDTSKIQHELIKLLAGKNGNLFMVGDEDQSIYGFRAAYPEALLDFEKDHPGAKDLCINNICILLVFFSAGLRQKASPYLGMATFSSLPAKKNPEQTAHVIFAQFLRFL